MQNPISKGAKVKKSRKLGRCGALLASRLVDADLSENRLAARLVVALAAGAADVAKDAVAALGPVLGELGIGLVVARPGLDANVGAGAGKGEVAGAADVAGEAVGAGVALGGGGAGSKSHGDGGESRLEDEADHFDDVWLWLWLWWLLFMCMDGGGGYNLERAEGRRGRRVLA